MPASKKNIKAFTQWTKYQFQLGMNPTTLAFPVDTTAELLRRVKMYKIFVARSDAIAYTSQAFIASVVTTRHILLIAANNLEPKTGTTASKKVQH